MQDDLPPPPFYPRLPWSGKVDFPCHEGDFPGPPDVTRAVPKYQLVTLRMCPGPACRTQVVHGTSRWHPGRVPVQPIEPWIVYKYLIFSFLSSAAEDKF